MDLHIGSFIKEIAERQKLGPTQLGKCIDSSKQNVYGIFKRKSIDTYLLSKISRCLDYDFFAEYSRRIGIGSPRPVEESGAEQIEALKLEVEELKKENKQLYRDMLDIYKKINGSGGGEG